MHPSFCEGFEKIALTPKKLFNAGVARMKKNNPELLEKLKKTFPDEVKHTKAELLNKKGPANRNIDVGTAEHKQIRKNLAALQQGKAPDKQPVPFPKGSEEHNLATAALKALKKR